MLKKLKSDNLFSFESHEDTSGEDLPEQGVVSEADAESVVAEATPSEDVTEAGDDVGQATPNDEIDATPDADLTATETETDTSIDSPDGSTTEIVSETTETGDAEEVNKLTEEGEQAAATKDEIVATATAEVTGGAEGGDVDVNGNAITPEQAAENAEAEQVDEEVDEEAEKTAADKDLSEQVDDVTENVDEELGEAIGDDSTDGGLDGESTDDTSTDIDAGGDQGDLGMDVETGSEGDVTGGDDAEFDDDTPLEGAEDAGTDSDAAVDDSAGDVGTDETDTGSDMDSVEPNDGGELGGADTESDTAGVDGDSEVADDVAKQNEAADVTAEAASADAEQTDFIAGDTPEQHGEEPATDELPANDGEEVVAEAEPAIQNQSDVGSDNANLDVTESTADDVDFEDDTPLEGAESTETEDLEVNAEQDLTPTEVDGQEATGPTGDGATVEESQSDQQADAIDEANDNVAPNVDPGAAMPEDGESEVETETETETDGSTEEVVEDITSDGEPGIDAEAGEIEETDEEADLEEGELDIPDVDTETTEEEVEDATVEADEVEAEADADEAQGDIADKTIEELQKEKESLEKFCVMIRWGIANESYNPGLLAYMVAESGRMHKVLKDLGCPVKQVSLESYDAKDMDLAYKATLESFRGVLSRMSGFSHQLTQKVERWWAKGMVDKVKSRTNALNKQIDLCLVQLKDSDKSTQEINAIGAYLSHADGNLVKAVSDDLKAITDIGGKGFKATEELQTNLVKALNDISGSGSPAEATSVADKVARFKDTKSAFPNRAFTPGLLGGYKLELKDANGGDTLKDKILNMGRRAVPVVVKEGKGDKSTQKLSKGDVANLLKMAKAYVALADKLADTTGDRAVDNVSKIRLTRERALPIAVEGRVRGGDEEAIDAAASALEMVAKAHNDLYKFVTKHCVDVADALCGVAKKFTK